MFPLLLTHVAHILSICRDLLFRCNRTSFSLKFVRPFETNAFSSYACRDCILLLLLFGTYIHFLRSSGSGTESTQPLEDN
jgi:hypothetical protein